MRLRALLAIVLLCAASAPASASLTSSEVGQVKDFVARAELANVTRVRAKVVRTDLTPEESTAVVVDALSSVSFEDKRPAFVRELLFGAGSAASRPLMTLAVTKGLLARAEGIHQRFAGGLDHEPRAIHELVRIYGFLDTEIGNAGKPGPDTHDATAGIPAETYDACAKAMAEHIDRNARVLKGSGAIDDALARVRTQAQIALVDLAPDGTTRRVDVAAQLGLDGPRREMLTDWGVLLGDAGRTDADLVKKTLGRLPGAREGVSVLFTGRFSGELAARQGVAYASEHEVVHDIAVMAAKQALDSHADLRAQAEKDVAAARDDREKHLGEVRAPSLDHYVGAALAELLHDPQRTVDLAFARFLGGRPESAALVADALLAVQEPKLDTITKITSGGFTFDGHAWSIERGGPRGIVVAIKRDGQNVTLGQLKTAKVPLKDGESWSDGATTFTRMRGTPKAAVLPKEGHGTTVIVAGQGAKGFDAIVTSAPAAFVLEADLTVHGGPGGIAIRATNGREAVKGLLLLVTPGGKAALVTTDDAGAESTQGAGIDPAPPMPVHVSIRVNGATVEATVGGTKLTGTAPTRGELGVVARHGAEVELTNLQIKKP